MALPDPIARLMEELARLPGIGPKSAQRLAYHLLKQDPETVRRLATAMVEARRQSRFCTVCQDLTDQDPCRICRSPGRDASVILVVEDPKDVQAVERTGEYHGVYHVLHGAIAPMDGIGPDALRIAELGQRLATGGVKEIILATDPDVEGDATALYLARLYQPSGIRVTRIARGLPVGGDLDYADESTLVKALQGRHEI